MENIIGLLIFLALLLFEALQRSKKNKQKQRPPTADDPYALPPPEEPESDLERALREIQDALTTASEPKPKKPRPVPPLPEHQEPIALPPRPLPVPTSTHRLPEAKPKVYGPSSIPNNYASEEAFERLPALTDESVVARPSVHAHIASHNFPSVAPPRTPPPKSGHHLISDLDLRDPDQLRRAVLLHEILGPPKSRRGGAR